MNHSILPIEDFCDYFFLAWTFYGAIHLGQDIRGNIGDPIKAPCDGELLGVRFGQQGGYTIYFLGNDGTIHRIMHCQKKTQDIKPGRVTHGDVMGYIGNTGLSKEPHAHWDIQFPNTDIEGLDEAMAWTNASLLIIGKNRTEATVRSRFIDPIEWMGHYAGNEETAPEWSLEAIELMQAKGIMGVDHEGEPVSFRPNDYVTRAELAVALSRLIKDNA